MSIVYPDRRHPRRFLGTKRQRVQAMALFNTVLLLIALLAAGYAAGLYLTGAPLLGMRCAQVILFAVGARLLLVRKRPVKIPVINYHSVSDTPEWLPNADRIAISPQLFEQHLAYLKKYGYRLLFLREVADLLSGRTAMEQGQKYAALTFDDGYADAWVFVYPLLKKYDAKATFFASIDFITEQDGSGRTGGQDARGYATWTELREMDASRYADIQAHGEQHTRIFTSGAPIDFNAPDRINIWMFWNMFRELKPVWWTGDHGDEEKALWGRPVYKQLPALAHPAVYPDPEIDAAMRAFVMRNGGRSFFDRSDWKDALHSEANTLRTKFRAEEAETMEQFAERVRTDLENCKQVLDEKLDKTVSILCWPENASSPIAERVARDVGFDITVANGYDTMNSTNDDATRIGRVDATRGFLGLNSIFLDRLGFILAVKRCEGYYACYGLSLCASAIGKAARRIRSM